MTINKSCSHDLRSAVQKVSDELGINEILLSHHRITSGIIAKTAAPASRQDIVASYDDAGDDIAVRRKPPFMFFLVLASVVSGQPSIFFAAADANRAVGTAREIFTVTGVVGMNPALFIVAVTNRACIRNP